MSIRFDTDPPYRFVIFGSKCHNKIRLKTALLKDLQVNLTVLCGITLALIPITHLPWMAYASVLFGSYFAVKTAYESLRARSIDVNFLMVLAALGAIVVGHPDDAAALLFLFSLSGTLEAYTMARTQSAIEGLIKLRPDTALRVLETEDERVPVEALKIGDKVKVPPYESIPVDGTVLQGLSEVNQAAMTGESIPVPKSLGERVLGGTENGSGTLVIEVASTVGDSTLDKIVALVQDAQENKASGERISTWFGQRYTFFVVGVFIASLLIRLAIRIPMSDALMSSLVLLVALSPCALVISTPATTLSALAWCARHGILVRGGQFIEQAGKVDTLAIDKTGTLTTGKPELAEICVCSGVHAGVGCEDEEACWRAGAVFSPLANELLAVAAGVEQVSTHPVAQAVVAAAERHGVTPYQVDDQDLTPGLGIRAIVEGKQVYIGQKRYLEDQGVHIPSAFAEHLNKLQDEGMSLALMSYGDQLAALGFKDSPREGASEMLARIRELGISQVSMVTGDTPETAKKIAEELGIDSVKAGLLPDEKTEVIAGLVGEGRSVLMVGDGVNDAPSLARANVGVAMGGLGSDVALNAADVVLMQDSLVRLPDLVQIGRKTNRIIGANLVFAAGVMCVLTLLSLFWKLPLPFAVLGHEGSTVLVILNGLRLLKGP